ncbi:quinate pathway repressor protein QutR [Purpureocillium lavendulum]|uniref:Quinate pathway repressor protein QutR n=1 Tax=Purpureocillium lavendulum TaxID=1247861 RepID=A0AB34G142_9HYPO|nr:quinate pathway repressor protein QutR [Purpureocillium lavendulum]
MAGVKRSLAAMMAHDGSPSADASPNHPSPQQGFTRPYDRESNSRTPTPPLHPVRGEIPSFSSDASLVLVGVRGAGKSTLAVMGASALKKRIVDLETAFHRVTGISSANFKQANGANECQTRQAEILDDVLRQNGTGTIIVCSWMERRIQNLLRQFAATNPVVHVVRPVDAIQDYLKIPDTSKAQNLLNMTNFYFRTCTNLEFFNVSEIHNTTMRCDGALRQDALPSPPPHLALQQAERHFLKFLSLIYPAGTIPFFESAFPLASISPEERQFTYALSLDMRDVLDGRAEWHDSTVGVDAVQIFVNSLVVAKDGGAIPDLFPVIANDITEAVAVVRRSTMLPILLHVKLPEQTIDEVLRLYLDLLTHAICLAPEMLTVDLRLDSADISRIMSAKRRSKLIGNYFTSTDTQSWDSPTWLSWYQKACQLGCDMARLVRFATSMEDNFSISRFRAKVSSLKEGGRIPLIAYNSGPVGRHSTCFNPILTLVAAKPVDPSNAGQAPFPYITAKEATEALYSSFVYDPMKLYVFGANVGYSMSPAMHNAALAACGIPHRYEPFSSTSLRGVKHLLQDPSFGGASVGLPFKVEVITLTHSLSPHAQAIGAVNTLIPIRTLNQDGSIPTGADLFRGVNRAGPVQALYGENTDWIGVRACIRRGLSPANAVRPSTWGLIIGAGGMARAATYAMLQVGVKNIAIYNRTPANAEKMATHFRQLLQKKDFALLSNGSETQFRILESLKEPWPADCRLPSIIISCIPTHPIIDTPSPEFELPEQWLGHQTGGVIIELGYKTLNTPLLAQAREGASRGWVAMDGLDLLPEQGFAQFELFTGRRAPRRVMRREVLENYTDEKGRSHLEELQQRLRSIVEQDT